LGYFSHGKSYVVFSQKMDWATLWAIFSQTHPVTLFGVAFRNTKENQFVQYN
jgi:hypothetical protein